MKYFIVHAHPEKTSFNRGLTDAACNALRAGGHEVVVSDLYEMGWDPVSDRRNFTTVKNKNRYRQTEEEMFASRNNGFAPVLKAEIDKALWCDVFIMQFPLWWFSMPAIMKGWVDRVFAMGPIYARNVWYDRGKLSGRRAMVSVTTGSVENMVAEGGICGKLDMILHPIHNGILRFVGFDVVEPFVVHDPLMMEDEEREAVVKRYTETVLSVAARPTLTFPSLDEYEPVTYARKTSR
jgi:NAD(P)H dehydrogenase (quinone)